jgi:lipopolysaccharide biosynthesis regulator YciM
MPSAEMFDMALLYILLLAAIALGWTLGYRFANQAKKTDYPDWIPSIDYILAERNDASLEKLLNVDQLDDDSVDLFLKLGKSLRDKGEIDRAMHLHQRLFARADLDRSVIHSIQLELAYDYSAAGLLDRAERILRELLEAKGHNTEHVAALLIELLEEEAEWRDILDLYTAKKLPGGADLSRRVAHAACELAERSLKKGEYLEVQQLCRQSLKIDSRCARAYVVSGDLAYGQQEYREAVRCYLKAAEVDQQAVVRILDKMIDAFAKLGDTEGLLNQLQRHWSNSHYIPTLTADIETLASEKNSDEATVRLLKELENSPSNQGFLTLAELVVKHRQQLDKSQLLQVYDILRRIVAAEPKFVCSSCGFKAKEPHWRCPTCKDWATVKAYVPPPPLTK